MMKEMVLRVVLDPIHQRWVMETHVHEMSCAQSGGMHLALLVDLSTNFLVPVVKVKFMFLIYSCRSLMSYDALLKYEFFKGNGIVSHA